jgi:hypothetical protein
MKIHSSLKMEQKNQGAKAQSHDHRTASDGIKSQDDEPPWISVMWFGCYAS